uniref:Uncharacterized protein n=1 Tax=Zea mays TaxID=4577 RepID=C0PE34_MAIZE|nr:unknown [Zea mays]
MAISSCSCRMRELTFSISGTSRWGTKNGYNSAALRLPSNSSFTLD